MKQNINRLFHLFWGELRSLFPLGDKWISLHRKPDPDEGLPRIRYFRAIVWVNIVCQLLFPLALVFTPAVVAARQDSMSEQISALQAEPEPMPLLKNPLTALPTASQQKNLLLLPELGADADMKAQGRDGDEPLAVREERERQEKLNQSMDAARQLWDMLGGPSPRDQGLERATGIASGMANQAVQDWLSQYGNARLSFSTQGTGSTDILVPLLDNPDLLLYAQPGIRLSDDRTTGNAGLGARYFTRDWMLGVNSFYDNDFTGNNRRLGVGLEAWRDYLKLSANGYFRLSDWHQSQLDAMQDYDERPANGWDIRAEAYLPSYPQIGGKLMYEQYQGKNVSLDGSTSDLRDNPSAVTFGVNWTPVPLIKVGVDHTTGSGMNNTNLTLDFSYRFGVPLADQLSGSSVGFARSLAGSRYDLVDRNYDIVLQYRKQELISLSLSASGSPYPGESVIIMANVTTKYGLDHVVWDAPALLGAGGSLTPLTAGTVRVTLPPASALSRMSREAPESYDIGAVAYDKHGNASNRAVLTLSPEKAPQDISSLTVTADNAAANGTAQNTVEVTATDTLAGQPLAGTEVELTFTHSGGAADGKVLAVQTVTTDSKGKAVVSVSSKLAGPVAVVAVLKRNGNSARTSMTFVADSATAGLSGNLVVDGDNAVADGKAGIKVTALVTDANGNPVINQTVTITTNNGAKPATVTVTTDENGNATVTVTSTTAGKTTVTATANGSTQSVDVNFIPGEPDAARSVFTADPVTLVADGSDASLLTLTLRDAQNNPLVMSSGVSLAVSGVQGATVSAVTGTDGVYTARLTGVRAGTATVTPVVKGVSLTALARAVSLAADAGTAQIASGALTVTVDRAVADDRAKNSVRAVVTDANGNPVSGVHVMFSTVFPARIMMSDYATNDQGIASASLASPAAGSTPVTATVNGSSQTVNVTFVADGATATLTSGSLTVKTTGAVADGAAQNSVSVRVTDANDNPVAGAEVAFSATNGVRIDAAGQTGSDGILVQTLTSTKAGSSVVTATVNGVSQTVSVAFVADARTAQFSGTPVITGNGAPASGRSIIGVDYLITDARGNTLAGQAVTITTNHGAIPETLTVTTDSNGVAHVEVTNTTAGITRVTATVNGQTQAADIYFVADSATATLTAANLKVITNNALANGVATNSVKALVTDAGGNPVPGMTVNFASDNGATIAATGITGADGAVMQTLTSKAAGNTQVTAGINGTIRSVTMTFKADGTTAGFDPVNSPGSSLTATSGAIANNTATNTVTATVTDQFGNPVPDLAVSFATDAGSSIVTSPVATNAAGIASTTVKATVAGAHTVTATVNSSSKTTSVTFVADGSTAGLDPVSNPGSSLTTLVDNQVANGTAADTVKATVTDHNGNPVAGLGVTFTVTAGATLTTTQGTTDAGGVATASVTSLTAGTYTVTATVNGSSKTTDTTFIPDSSTAGVDTTGNPGSRFEVTRDNQVANGTATDEVSATVTDRNGNPVPGVSVVFTAAGGASIVSSPVMTDLSGVAVAQVSALTAKDYVITAKVNTTTATVMVNFIPDATTAGLGNLNPGSSLTATSGAKADNTSTNTVTATVTDKNGNQVNGVVVNFAMQTGDTGATVVNTTATTVNGIATAGIKATVAGQHTVTATVGATSLSVDTAFSPDETTAGLNNTGGSLTSDGPSVADDSAVNLIAATVTDANGNPVKNQTVVFTLAATQTGVTLTTLQGVTDVSGKATANVKSAVAGTFTVTATVNGDSKDVATVFTASTLTATITSANMIINPDGAVANGTTTNGVRVTVTDALGNVVPGMPVVFSTCTSATITPVTATSDAMGRASATVVSTRSGGCVAGAKVNGYTQTKAMRFVADTATAGFDSLTSRFDTVRTGQLANGIDTDAVEAVITDANGNPVEGVTVTFSASNGATVLTASATTDADGRAGTDIASLTAGTSTVAASFTSSTGHTSTRTTDVVFAADAGSATITAAGLVVTSGAKADGVAVNTATVTVTDASGNAVPGAKVSFSAPGTTIATAEQTADGLGVVTVTFSTTVAGVFPVTASTNGHQQTKSSAFIADETTAAIADMVITPVSGAKANGAEVGAVAMTVLDAFGNPVPDLEVTFSTDVNVSVAESLVRTDAAGQAITTLKSIKAGTYAVTARLPGGDSQTRDALFIADTDTAHFGAMADITKNGSLADGVDKNGVSLTVMDANGNRLAGVQVAFTASTSASRTDMTVTTDAEGVAHVDVGSTLAGNMVVEGKVNGVKQDVTVFFIADAGTAGLSNPGGDLIATSGAVADGTATNTVTATVTDAKGNPVPGLLVSFEADAGSAVVTSPVTTDAFGIARTTVTATRAGGHTITARAEVGEHVVSTRSVITTFVAGAPDETLSTFTADQNTVIADDTDAAILMLTLQDANGNPVTGIASELTLDHTGVSGSNVIHLTKTDKGNGVYEFSLTGTKAGTLTLTPQRNGTTLVTTPAVQTVTLVAGPADDASSTFSAAPLTITADNTQTSTVTLTLKDAKGNLVTGKAANIALTDTVANTTLSTVTETPALSGIYVATLKGSTPGTDTLTAIYSEGATTVTKTATVTLTARVPVAANSTFTVSPASITANGGGTGGTSVLTYTLKDASSNPVSGVAANVNFQVKNVANTTISTVTETAPGSGIYTANLTGTMAGTATVTPVYVNGETALTLSAKTVALTPELSTAIVSMLSSTENAALANNSDTQTLTATVKDAYGNVVPGATVAWSTSSATLILSAVTSTTNASGVTTITVTDKMAETASVTANVSTNSADTGLTAAATFTLYPVVSGITPGVTNSPADGATQNTLIIQVSDLAGNALTNTATTLNFAGTDLKTGPATLKYGVTGITAASTALPVTTDGSGQVLLTATNVTAESISVSVQVSLSTQEAKTASSTFVLYPLLGGLSVGTNSVPADNTATNSVIATFTNKKGAPLPAGTVVTFTFSLDKGTARVTNATSPSWTGAIGAGGQVTFLLADSSANAETVTLKGYVQGSAVDQKTATTNFVSYTLSNISVNGVNFSTSSGFPTTGFKGASFQLRMNNVTTWNEDFIWSTSQPAWTSVDSVGNVTFTGIATTAVKSVTITATPKGGGASARTFSFTLGAWFTSNGSAAANWSTANGFCSTRGGLATTQQLRANGTRGTLGGVWSEWGNMGNYPGSGFLGSTYWSSEIRGASDHYNASLLNGVVAYDWDYVNYYVVCRVGL